MNEIAVVENNAMEIHEMAMSPASIRAQVNAIQKIMQEVMKDGEHYGVVPGCGDKPTLLKPGAEKLGTTFRLSPAYTIDRDDLPGDHREYNVKCTLTHINTGKIIGEGVGCCSTKEGKYRFRNASVKCPNCGKETVIKGRAEYGGGWICYGKKGGCGAKWADGDQAIEGQERGKIEHDNPADYYNTVLKMAKKRAHVDAILTATAASDIFTQDIEDLKDLGVMGSQETPPQAAKKNRAGKPAYQKNDPVPAIAISVKELEDKFNTLDKDGLFSEFLVFKKWLKTGQTTKDLSENHKQIMAESWGSFEANYFPWLEDKTNQLMDNIGA